MAKKSVVARNTKRIKIVAATAAKRAAIKAIINSSKRTPEEKFDAMRKLHSLKRNASPVRLRNRCLLTGRGRSVYRRFGLSRIMLRELAMFGKIPGIVKSSW